MNTDPCRKRMPRGGTPDRPTTARPLGALLGVIAAAACTQAMAFTDVIGNPKQNHFGVRQAIATDFCRSGQVCDVVDVTGDGFDDLVAIDPMSHTLRIAVNMRDPLIRFAFTEQDYVFTEQI